MKGFWGCCEGWERVFWCWFASELRMRSFLLLGFVLDE